MEVVFISGFIFCFWEGEGERRKKGERKKNRIEERGGMNNSGVFVSCVNFLFFVSYLGVIEM